MAQIQGKAVLFGSSAASGTPVTFTVNKPDGTAITGYITGIVAGFPVNHNAQQDRIMDESGEIVSTMGFGEFLEATFDMIPAGTAMADARNSAQLPPIMSTVSITGADVVAMGAFTDAVNVTTGDPGGNKWIYEGGGTVNWRQDSHGSMTLPLRRYLKIVGGTAISS